ncbi:hypothetical protein E2320_010081 [Naja naja]|nr:hypothetical protein E2320_010081 [Naja naja]
MDNCLNEDTMLFCFRGLYLLAEFTRTYTDGKKKFFCGHVLLETKGMLFRESFNKNQKIVFCADY